MSVFVDTSFWCALLNRADANHEAAAGAQAALEEPQVTTSYVVAETSNLLMARARPDIARRYLRQTLLPGWCHVVHPSSAAYDLALEMVLHYRDKDFGLTDAVSFVVMSESDIRNVLAFDAHFRQMGFRMIPE
ncbi:MAG: PIN domain-containing protein [Armatimonadota bacterium]